MSIRPARCRRDRLLLLHRCCSPKPGLHRLRDAFRNTGSAMLSIRARARQWPCSLPTCAAADSCPEKNKHSRRAPVERHAFREGKRGHPSMQEMPGPALLDMKWFGLYAYSASARRNYNKRHGEAFARKYSSRPRMIGLTEARIQKHAASWLPHDLAMLQGTAAASNLLPDLNHSER